MPLNFDSVSINGSRVSFSGLGTGIDFTAAVDGIISAKSIPIDTLEQRVSDNTTQIDALRIAHHVELPEQFNRRHARRRSLGDTSNTFAAKQAFSSTSRSDGSTPSIAGNLIGVTVDNAASVGTHELEIRRIATAHIQQPRAHHASFSVKSSLADGIGQSMDSDIDFRAAAFCENCGTVSRPPLNGAPGNYDEFNRRHARRVDIGKVEATRTISLGARYCAVQYIRQRNRPFPAPAGSDGSTPSIAGNLIGVTVDNAASGHHLIG